MLITKLHDAEPDIDTQQVNLIVAWNLLEDEGRAAFRDAAGVDQATWERGRAWALSIGVIAYPYYLHTNPA
ncbi:hypothetical protein [Arthrobacter sp. ok362]|jgi:hypothetical protein|uniref:hypothetical protein n=1 Tax=Arthrobacter sp. ok362 TaxID=1761745 RepID=UPI000889EE82|nr:hypothetical protein [Arthrobacter sp. ok362]SDK96490.1 hypothetical protein SAMN04487913_104260 [Arthrobacter sp. ok362]